MAPDAYAGFTMTLLRMLAFRPDAATKGAGAGAASGGAPRTAKAPEIRSNEASAPPPAPRATTATIKDWPETARALKLGGIARQLAQQSAMVSFSDLHLKLKVGAAQKHLTGQAYQNQLAAALEEHLGVKVRVSVDIGATAGGSAQDKAVESISEDALVRGLIEQFDATIVESSIKPVR